MAAIAIGTQAKLSIITFLKLQFRDKISSFTLFFKYCLVMRKPHDFIIHQNTIQNKIQGMEMLRVCYKSMNGFKLILPCLYTHTDHLIIFLQYHCLLQRTFILGN